MSVRRQRASWAGLVAFAALVACAGGHKVHPLGEGGSEGVYYALPRSVVTVEVAVTKVETKSGQCTAAPRAVWQAIGLAPIHDRINSSPPGIVFPNTRYKLAKPILGTRVEPDPGAVYVVELTGSLLRQKKLALELSELGLIVGATSDVKDRTVELVSAGLGAVAAAAGTAARHAMFPASSLPPVPTPTNTCAQIASAIVDVRNRRVELLGGGQSSLGGNIPLATFEKMLAGLQSLEAGLTANFTGVETKTTGIVNCEWLPTHAAMKSGAAVVTQLFRATPTGIATISQDCVVSASLASNAAGGVPYSLETQFDTSQMAESVRTSLNHPKAWWQWKGVRRDSGFAYRVPGRITAVAKKGGDRLVEKRLVVGQLGPVVRLPYVRANRVHNTIKFFSESGGLKSVSSNQEVVDPAAIRALGSAASEAILSKPTELEELESKRKVLEEQKKIRDLEVQLDNE